MGPGRSGSTFLYDILNAHPNYQAPRIKEGYYYRHPAKVARLCKRLGRDSVVLMDVANLAYIDSALLPGVKKLHSQGVRILLVVLFRAHRDRAQSMMAYRKSRGEFSAWFGQERLERAVVRDSLTPELMASIYQAKADVITVSFPALVDNTPRVLEYLAEVCGTAGFRDAPRWPVNESLPARSMALSALGKQAAIVMRFVKLHRALALCKRSPVVKSIFFTSKGRPAQEKLSADSERLLTNWERACHEVVERSGDRVQAGIWRRRAIA